MNEYISISRLFPALRVLAMVIASTFLFDVSLALAFGHTPKWLPGAFDANVMQQFGSRLAKAEQLQNNGKLNSHNLVAMIGLSPVREDCDPALLAENDPSHRDWLILGAQGRTFATLDVYGTILADSPIHPRRVILGIMPSMLHRDDHAAPADADFSRLPQHLRHRQLNHVLLDLSWLYRNRDSLADTATQATYQATNLVRAFFRLPMSVTYPPERDMFTSWTSVMTDHSDAGHMVLQWHGHQQLLVPDEFEGIDRQIAAFAELVRRLRERGAEVILVLMPETSRLRTIYPPGVLKKFDDALNFAAAGVPLTKIDLSSAIDDDLFWDDGHLNPRGRQLFSAKLPTLLTQTP